ncbi:spliceosome-associated protein CWC15 homolog isoform X2 [Oscarella lobularis]|uniref:spliceosome-associated protein CWC15 homolog isoform X2 n=1 Tax=Oscarella lobularis TaxID=121494 RepID=UPI0033136570
MTTAARPTFEPARGGSGKGEKDLSALSKHYSSRDLPGQLKLKSRGRGQGTTEELRERDFRSDLEERERRAAREKAKERGERVVNSPKRQKPAELPPPTADPDKDDDDDDDDDDDSDEDDTAELLRELQKIKQERAEEEARKERERKDDEERIRKENIVSGNPLLNSSDAPSGFKVKRRWDDDVVFKNCARGVEENPKERKFINDTIRSEFHKRFMSKYIK